jgi:hypothetical protein
MAVAVMLCVVAGMAVVVAFSGVMAACQEGVFEHCQDGRPSFELVIQLVFAVAGFAATIVTSVFAHRRSYVPAGALLVVAAFLFAGWAVFLYAATHG